MIVQCLKQPLAPQFSKVRNQTDKAMQPQRRAKPKIHFQCAQQGWKEKKQNQIPHDKWGLGPSDSRATLGA